jgi:hypothetical protein
MKKTNLLTIAVLTLILLLAANPAAALDPIPKNPDSADLSVPESVS